MGKLQDAIREVVGWYEDPGCPPELASGVATLRSYLRDIDLKRKYSLPPEEGEVPRDLQEDFRAVFGTDVPPMKGNLARTPVLRAELVRRAIHDYIFHGVYRRNCPCGCGYLSGCAKS